MLVHASERKQIKPKPWNRCDVCGRFIPHRDFFDLGLATRELVTPDSDYSIETYETLCRDHARKPAVARATAR